MGEVGARGESSSKRVMAHRRSLARAGVKRVEVTVPVEDSELVRGVAARLRAGGDDAAELRALLEQRVASRRATSGAELVAFFRASPLTEMELEVIRDPSPGRPVDL